MKPLNSFLIRLSVLAIFSLSLSCNLNAQKGKKQKQRQEIASRASTVQPNAAYQWKKGRNDFIMPWDGEDRHFIVYVPQKFNDSRPTPLVYMFHGSGGTGQKMYNVTTWKEEADKQGFIVIFPSAWEYYIVDKNRKQSKWATAGLHNQVKTGTKIMDDVGFVKAMLNSTKASMNIDDKRIYASGFSNGGGFVSSKLLPEMGDTFAALSSGGNTFSFNYAMQNPAIPYYQIVGSRDNKIYERSNIPLPDRAPDWIDHAEYGKYIDNALLMLNLEEDYQHRENDGHSTIHYQNSKDGGRGEFIFSVIKGMGHSYPNGKNNPSNYNAPSHLWQFFMANPKP